MESSCLGVILDSSVVIEAERDRMDAASLLKWVAKSIGEREVALCAITVAELAHGIHRATTAERHRMRRLFLDDLKAALRIYPVTSATAELVGKIGAESAEKGVVIPFDDLLIGVCALELGYAVVTRNIRHFRKIPGLEVLSLD